VVEDRDYIAVIRHLPKSYVTIISLPVNIDSESNFDLKMTAVRHTGRRILSPRLESFKKILSMLLACPVISGPFIRKNIIRNLL
jgi:hypothetical protein